MAEGSVAAPAGLIRRWVKHKTGREVMGVRALDSIGASREIWIVDLASPGGGVEPMLIRRASSGGLFSGTPFHLRRETAILDRINQFGLSLPAVHAVTAAGDMMLMQVLPGGSDYGAAPPAQQQALASDCAGKLAALHAIPLSRLEATTATIDRLPSTPAIIRSMIRYDEVYLEPYARAGAPVDWLNDALHWLGANAPAPVTPVLLQGDAGPPNFMFEGERVTGLIDWEIAHAGDPADDLAMIYYRMAIQRREAGVEDWYRAYERHTGNPHDTARVNYFILLNLVRSALAGWSHFQRNPLFGEARMSRNKLWVGGMLAHLHGSSLALQDQGFRPPPA